MSKSHSQTHDVLVSRSPSGPDLSAFRRLLDRARHLVGAGHYCSKCSWQMHGLLAVYIGSDNQTVPPPAGIDSLEVVKSTNTTSVDVNTRLRGAGLPACCVRDVARSAASMDRRPDTHSSSSCVGCQPMHLLHTHHWLMRFNCS